MQRSNYDVKELLKRNMEIMENIKSRRYMERPNITKDEGRKYRREREIPPKERKTEKSSFTSDSVMTPRSSQQSLMTSSKIRL